MVLSTSSLRIDRNTNYNLVCGKPLSQPSDSFEGLVLALEEVGFRFYSRMRDELAKDKAAVIGRTLEQVIFARHSAYLGEALYSPLSLSSSMVPSR
jgi:hypothetical protein